MTIGIGAGFQNRPSVKPQCFGSRAGWGEEELSHFMEERLNFNNSPPLVSPEPQRLNARSFSLPIYNAGEASLHPGSADFFTHGRDNARSPLPYEFHQENITSPPPQRLLEYGAMSPQPTPFNRLASRAQTFQPDRQLIRREVTPEPPPLPLISPASTPSLSPFSTRSHTPDAMTASVSPYNPQLNTVAAKLRPYQSSNDTVAAATNILNEALPQPIANVIQRGFRGVQSARDSVLGGGPSSSARITDTSPEGYIHQDRAIRRRIDEAEAALDRPSRTETRRLEKRSALQREYNHQDALREEFRTNMRRIPYEAAEATAVLVRGMRAAKMPGKLQRQQDRKIHKMERKIYRRTGQRVRLQRPVGPLLEPRQTLRLADSPYNN